METPEPVPMWVGGNPNEGTVDPKGPHAGVRVRGNRGRNPGPVSGPL